MNDARELLSELESLGVELSANGDRLHVKAPRGVVSYALREKLASQKAELLCLLAANDGSSNPTVRESGAKVWRCVVDGTSMTVIDPARLSHDQLLVGLRDRFGYGRVGSLTQVRLMRG